MIFSLQFRERKNHMSNDNFICISQSNLWLFSSSFDSSNCSTFNQLLNRRNQIETHVNYFSSLDDSKLIAISNQSQVSLFGIYFQETQLFPNSRRKGLTILKTKRTNWNQSLWKFFFDELRTSWKATCTNWSKRFGEINYFQSSATFETILFYVCHRIRNADWLNPFVIIETKSMNFFNRMRNDDWIKISTTFKAFSGKNL
jgi:hypothetical protein